MGFLELWVVFFVYEIGAFFVSGLIHEWVIACASTRPTTLEQLNFFLIHGLITVLQVIFEKIIKKVLGRNPLSKLPNIICIAITWVLFLMTTSFFVNPWVREDIINRIRIPAIQELF